MKPFVFTLTYFICFTAASQDFYTLRQVDSIPVHFYFATTDFIDTDEVTPKLEEIRLQKGGKIIVNAYTDTVGTIEYNTGLAEKRLLKVLDLIAPDPQVPVFSFNRNEQRDLPTVSTPDTLFRRVDILVYKNQLTIELDKPYPLQINFDGNQSYLRDEAKPMIDKMIAILEKEPELNIELHGHISGHTPTYDLSLNRTLSVKHYMVERGIHPDRITCKGFDNTRKLVPEESWESNPLNRRVEIVFLKNTQSE